MDSCLAIQAKAPKKEKKLLPNLYPLASYLRLRYQNTFKKEA